MPRKDSPVIDLSEQDLFAIDPGKNNAGVAYFRNRKLVAAGLIRASDPLEVIERVLVWGAMNGIGFQGNLLSVHTLVTEGQQIYPRSPVDPNDLLPLAFVCGGIQAGVFAVRRVMPLPREWKGNVPKDVHVRKTLARLNKQAVAIVDAVEGPKSLLHNTIDAIGLGLWALGLDKQQAFLE